MLVDFSSEMTCSATIESARIFDMTDRFVARSLLSTARAARAHHSLRLRRTEASKSFYPVFYVWDVVPEIAARLGETVFMQGERSDAVRQASGADLRAWALECLTHSGSMLAALRDRSDPFAVLCADPVNGNPVFVALDRLFPDVRDSVTRRLEKTSQARGFPPRAFWVPELNGCR